MTYGTDLVQQYIDMGGILPLDDLLAEYGQELKAFLGDEVLQYGQYDVGAGKEQYYLPARRIMSRRRACSSARTGWKSWAWKFPRTWKSCMPT